MSIEHLRELFEELVNPSSKDSGGRAVESFRILADEIIKLEAIDFRSDVRVDFLRIQSRMNSLRQRGSFTVTKAREACEGIDGMFDAFTGDAESLSSNAYKGLPKLNIELLEKIGSGWFGVVFRGTDPDLERDVAVKVIKPSRNAPDAIEHAKDLAKAGPHPNIVVIHNVGMLFIEHFNGELPVAIMEWMPGKNLSERVRGPLFTKTQVEKICKGIVEGMAQLHSCGVGHGDMHFENIFIKPDHTAVIIDVDSTRDNTFSRISTASRADIVYRDVVDCRKAIVEVFTHSEFTIGQTNVLDSDLKPATTLNEVTSALGSAFAKQTEEGANPEPSIPKGSVSALAIDLIESDAKKPALQRIVVAETKSVCSELLSDRFDCGIKPNAGNVKERVKEYEQITKELNKVLAAGGFWAENRFDIWGNAIASLANAYTAMPNPSQGFKTFLHMRLFPPLVSFYIAGFGAWLNGNFKFLKFIISELEYVEMDSRRKLSTELQHTIWECAEDWKQYVLEQSRLTPLSEYLASKCIELVAPNVSQSLPELEREFDRFEYFLGLADSYDPSATETEIPLISWAPIGRFIWRTNTVRRHEKTFGQDCLAKAEQGEERFPFLDAGFFNGNKKALELAIIRYELYCKEAKRKLEIRI